MEKKRFGVYVPDDLAKDIDACMKTLGLKSKSKLIQEALRLFINEHKWKLKGKAVGIVGIVYDHEASDVDEKLTDIQHRYLDTIVSSVHVHLDKRRCMLAIIVRGRTENIRHLINDIINIKGILTIRQMLLASE